MIDSLVQNHFAVAEAFLSPEEVDALARELETVDHSGQMKPAGVGRAEARQRVDSIRTDRIHWLGEDSGAASGQLLAKLEGLRGMLNESLFLGLAELEAHFALYEPGGFYAKHLDRFSDESSRVISLVLYLNRDWREGDGGELRLYEPSGATREIAPRAGRLVIFRSDTVWHEVLSSRCQRRSVAGWFRRRPLP